MKGGRFIAVVGPSGVGKDSVIEGICAHRPELRRARRVITRPPAAGGEPFDSVDAATFARMEREGAFVLSWGAHGLFYGIPARVRSELAAGSDVIANLSRGVLGQAASRFPRLTVLSIVAAPEVLAARLAARGREAEADISRRLARGAPPLPDGLSTAVIDNGGALEDSVAAVLGALYPARV